VTVASRQKIVVLGMMTKMPVAGVVWQTLHYLVGFARLGYDVYYVEAHGRTPSMLMQHEDDDSSAQAAAFLSRVLTRFDLGHKWAYHALHADGRCYGMSATELSRLYASAAVILNLHGGTEPLPEHSATGRLVYLETDPVQLQIELHDGVQQTLDFLEPHVAFFTFGENLGRPDCRLPVSDRFAFRPTRQPVVLDFWSDCDGPGEQLTTIGNWRQDWRPVHYQGETYSWSKHVEFLKFLELPRLTGQAFELALSSSTDADRDLLQEHGWAVRPGLEISTDIDTYRRYIGASLGEFTVAKDQNVRLRSGWFSDRSATYLAAGRPVVTQETGFSNVLPTGKGLLPFVTVEEAAAAVTDVAADYAAHSRAALDVARECFDSAVVLRRLLAELGESRPRRNRSATGLRTGLALPTDLVLTPVSKRPTMLADDTVRSVLAAPLPAGTPRGWATERPTAASIVIVSYNNLVFTRMCLETVLATTRDADAEVLMVDNGSRDGTHTYLAAMAERFPALRLLLNDSNRGFVRAANQGFDAAHGRVLVLLNNDTVVPTGWLSGLVRHLDDHSVGLVGPLTNAAGNEARVSVPYDTYGGLLDYAAELSSRPRRAVDIPVLTMFCVALRREVYARLGSLDEQFELGMFEDDDYAERLREAGLRVVCAQDVFVHHFGEASFGKLVPTGEYGDIFRANQRRFAAKWGKPWTPHERPPDDDYDALVEQIRDLVCARVPAGAGVLVVSKGDDRLLELGGPRGLHFPQDEKGGYAGHHPADDREAIDHVEAMRARGAEYLLFPRTASWWLEHYSGLCRHLQAQYESVVDDDACRLFALDGA
jgi:GT2 family glycosyltransferase